MRPSCYRNFKGIIVPEDDEREDCDECEYRCARARRLAHMNSTLDDLKIEDKKLADELKVEEAELDKKIEEKLRAVFIQ